MNMIKPFYVSCLLALSLLTPCLVKANPTASQYQEILNENLAENEPGVSVIISKNGKVLFKGARGLANLEHNIALNEQSVLRLGSISKQFTAAAIMMLQEQGKLAVTDDIHKYVASFPTEGNLVTIENLLTHTSGIANYTDDDDLFDKEIQVPTSVDDTLARFAKHPMVFKPGEAMAYSNTGYSLLGKIIEVASGQSYKDFIEQHIFKKLKMNQSSYEGQEIVAHRAAGYEQTEQGFINTSYINMDWPYAAGALISTPTDLNIWFNALSSGKLISKAGYEKMVSPFKLNDGSFSSYGYGLIIKPLNEYTVIKHTGGINGFLAHARYIPEQKLYVAVLANSNHINPIFINEKLTAKALGIALPEFKKAEVTEQQLAPVLGDYRIDENTLRSLIFENDVLYSKRTGGDKTKLITMSKNSFYYPNSNNYLVIEKNSQGQLVMKYFSGLSTTPTEATKI